MAASKYQLVAALLLCSCASDASTVEPLAATIESAVARDTSAPTTGVSEVTPPSSIGATTASSSTVPGCVPQCRTGKLTRPGPLAAGDYTTVNFFAGALTVTVDDGWESHEDSTGEFELHRADGTAISLWLDVYPVKGCATPGCPTDEAGARVNEVGPDAAALAAWLHANPNLTVEDGEQLTVDRIPFDSLNVAVADDANNDDPDCPGKPCVSILGFPEWDAPAAFGRISHLRLYLADIEYGDKNHLLVIATDGPGSLDVIAKRTDPVLKTLDLPAVAAEAARQAALTYVAFGDSWPYGAHCHGCVPFPELYKRGLAATTDREIVFVNRTQNGGTSASLLDSIMNSQAVRDSVANADIIMISTGANDLEPAFDAFLDHTCGGDDDLDCFRDVAQGWRENFDAILTEIEVLRVGRPTAVRIVTTANEALADAGLIDLFGAEFGRNEGASITAMQHDALCDAAAEHDAVCVDLRPVLNGPNFDQPADGNTQESMRAVADALVASGVSELG